MPESIEHGMNVEENWIHKLSDKLLKVWDKADSYSDIMIAGANIVRREKFSDDNREFSDYEKKLILLGFTIKTISDAQQDYEKMTRMKHTLGFLRKILDIEPNTEPEELRSKVSHDPSNNFPPLSNN